MEVKEVYLEDYKDMEYQELMFESKLFFGSAYYDTGHGRGGKDGSGRTFGGVLFFRRDKARNGIKGSCKTGSSRDIDGGSYCFWPGDRRRRFGNLYSRF